MPATRVPARPLDDTDRILLEALLRDGRASHRELASRTGLSLATVNRRVRSLEADGIIKGYTAVLESEAVGWAFTAIVGLRIDKGYLREVQEQISRDPRVISVYDVTGDWDGVVIARLTDRADLDDLAKTTLSVEHIQRTTTLMVLKTVTEDALVRLP
ncbi:MAG: Lrp/AsnC family transcriptional regulator [Thermoplasmatota archaeon]